MSSPLASNVIDRVDKLGHDGSKNGFVLLVKCDPLFARVAQTKLEKIFCCWRGCGGKAVDGFEPDAPLIF